MKGKPPKKIFENSCERDFLEMQQGCWAVE
jgi:hypothetical protein